MIIGNGLLGNGFANSEYNLEKYLIFVSGVSNSQSDNMLEFNREKELVLKSINENKNLKFIYFSSILVDINDNHYYKHKLMIENIISEECENYIIFRVPQIIGKYGNENNLVNFIKTQIISDEEVLIYDGVTRSIIDVVDLVGLVNYSLDKINNEIVYVSKIETISVLDLVKLISVHLDKDPVVLIKNDHDYINWNIENSKIINDGVKFLNIDSINYTNNVIKKYIKK